MSFREPAIPSLVFPFEVNVALVLDSLVLVLYFSFLNQDPHLFLGGILVHYHVFRVKSEIELALFVYASSSHWLVVTKGDRDGGA